MRSSDFRVRVVGTQIWNPADDNLDVEVTFVDGSRFGATFFTLRNVERLFERNRVTGECGGGRYLWASNMILVQELTTEVIGKTVQNLLDSEEFFTAFARFGDG